VTIERQLGRVWQVAASYLGSYTDRLWNQVAINPGVFLGLGPCTLQGVFYATCTNNGNLNQRRVFSQSGENPAAARLIGNLDIHDDVGTQAYRGLRLSFRRRAADGVSLNGNYTISRCFGHATTGGFPQLAQGPINPDDPDMDRGHCDQDRTHLANLTVAVQTPDFGGALANALASGWRVAGILNARSGSWLNITTGRDVALNGQRFQEQRVNQVSDDVYGAKSLTGYLNRAAFAQPAPGTFGNYERNSIRGPAFWTIDLALSKLVTFVAAQTLELRVEAFNVLNNFNWGNPGTNLNAATFGRIRALPTGASMRILQFGVKYGF